MSSFPLGLGRLQIGRFDLDLTEDWNHQSYILYAFTFDYVILMILVAYFYSQIVKTVFVHEVALRAQAKKMNVESLRANQDASKNSIEFRIAKVAITNVFIWAISWTPYVVIVMTACFGNRSLITPADTGFHFEVCLLFQSNRFCCQSSSL